MDRSETVRDMLEDFVAGEWPGHIANLMVGAGALYLLYSAYKMIVVINPALVVPIAQIFLAIMLITGLNSTRKGH